MELLLVIFYILIFAVIAGAKKAAQSGQNYEKSPKVSQSGKAVETNIPKSSKAVMPNVPKSGKMIVPNVPMKKNTEKIFMEPHEEEKIQPKIKNNNLWGEDEHANQRIVALRLMEGDPVPEGYVRIRCPYCAADNLVTKNCRQYHSCYFCRVPID